MRSLQVSPHVSADIGNRVDRPPLAGVAGVDDGRDQRVEVDHALADAEVRAEEVLPRVRVRVAHVHVADLALHHLDELELSAREPLGGLHVVVGDDAGRLDVADVVHQLEVVVADVVHELHGLARLDEDLAGLELPEHGHADLGALLGVRAEHRHDAVPRLVVVGVAGQRAEVARVDAHRRDPAVHAELQVIGEELLVGRDDVVAAGRPRVLAEVAVGAGRVARDLEIVAADPVDELATTLLVGVALDGRVVEEPAELDAVVAEGGEHLHGLLERRDGIHPERDAPASPADLGFHFESSFLGWVARRRRRHAISDRPARGSRSCPVPRTWSGARPGAACAAARPGARGAAPPPSCRGRPCRDGRHRAAGSGVP